MSGISSGGGSPIWDRHSVPPAATALVARVEGDRLRAYQDSRGKWTIGYGSTVISPGGRAVRPGDVLTQAQAEALLAVQLSTWAAELVGVVPSVTVIQATALISFVHNLGIGNLRGSTLLKMLEAGKVALAGGQFNGWAEADGQVEIGLLRRREYERRIFMGETTEMASAYNAVWALGEAQLMPLYAKAFADARAWNAGPVAKPTPAPAQPGADALMEQELNNDKGAT